MRTELNDGSLTLYLEGRIDSANAADFERGAMAAVDGAPDTMLVIDADGLDYISSAGLRVLMKLLKRVGNALPVINVSPSVYEVFEMTGFTELLDVSKQLREVSVEGCEVIGRGGFGKVYRIDDETIVKVYNPGLSLELVNRERNISQKAFLMGVPTAISFDVVRVGECYGVVYEMLDAKTTAQLIEEDPTKIPQIAGECAKLLKELHAVEPGPEAGLPNRKQQLKDWVDSLSDFITEEEADKIKAFIDTIPDRGTFLHGDFNAKNIMVRNGEFQLIDVGDAALGHPVFDIVGLMLAYIILPQSAKGGRSAEERRDLLGFDLEYAQQMWGVMCATYFGLRSPDEIATKTQQLMPYCFLLMLYQAVRILGADKQAIALRIDMLMRHKLMPAIEHAAPLDF